MYVCDSKDTHPDPENYYQYTICFNVSLFDATFALFLQSPDVDERCK